MRHAMNHLAATSAQASNSFKSSGASKATFNIYCRPFLIGIESVEVKPTIAKKFRRMMNKLSDGTNISGSCVNWYRNKSGINFVLWPTNTLRYWWMTRRVDLLRDFKLSVMD